MWSRQNFDTSAGEELWSPAFPSGLTGVIELFRCTRGGGFSNQSDPLRKQCRIVESQMGATRRLCRSYPAEQVCSQNDGKSMRITWVKFNDGLPYQFGRMCKPPSCHQAAQGDASLPKRPRPGWDRQRSLCSGKWDVALIYYLLLM